MKVTFEIDDAIYPIAKEWTDFIEQHPLPHYDDDPKKYTEIDDVIQAEWKRFLKKHNLIKSRKTTYFTLFNGSREKIEHIEIKNYKEYQRAFDILTLKNDYNKEV